MKKPNGAATKAKGRDLMLAIKTLLLLNAPWLSEDDFLVKATSMLGVDLHVSPRAAEWFPFAVEGKNTETLQIWAALTQAQYNAAKQGKPAIVFFKRAGTPIYVALAAIDLLTLLPWPKNLPTPSTSSATPDPMR